MNRRAACIVAVSFALLTGPVVASDDELSAQGLLSVAKVAGACGIMDSLIHFQKTTKMNGGDEFVARFWAVEATRLGMSVKQYSDQCSSAVNAYDRLWKAAEQEKK